MENDVGRNWTLLTPFVAGAEQTPQAQEVEAIGMAGIGCPSIYGSALVGCAHVAAVAKRVWRALGRSTGFCSQSLRNARRTPPSSGRPT